MALLHLLGPACLHIFTLSLLEAKMNSQQWSFQKSDLNKTETHRTKFLNINPILPPEVLWVFTQ